MISLVFTVCLIGNPEVCEQREMHFVEPISVMACTMGAQGELARWRQTNVNWAVTRWRCEAERNEQEA
ncbi:MAG TPA: hypothetical protein VFR34_08100 [Paracoccaceae bacterium]|nr:hypothetical protein [Paracoccaceae bacterium]